jgi:hypothetical protein
VADVDFEQLGDEEGDWEDEAWELELLSPTSPTARQCDSRGIPARVARRPIGKIVCSKASAYGVDDPVGVIKRARERALDMLDTTIDQLLSVRKAVCAGAPPAPPLLSPLAFCWLKDGFSINVDDIRVWTAGTFEPFRSIAEVIRRLVRVRNELGSSGLRYSCTSPRCKPRYWAFTRCLPRTPLMLIRLCRLFWVPEGTDQQTHAEFQAQTLIHETSHLTHCNDRESGRTIAVPECLTQFVAITNDSPLDPCFVDACAGTDECRKLLGGNGRCDRDSSGRVIKRTLFRPGNSTRLRGQPAARRMAEVEFESGSDSSGEADPLGQWPPSRHFGGPAPGSVPVGPPQTFSPCSALLDERRRLSLAVDEVKGRMRERPSNARRVAEAADVLTAMCRQMVSILQDRWYIKQGCTKQDLHLFARSASAMRGPGNDADVGNWPPSASAVQGPRKQARESLRHLVNWIRRAEQKYPGI